jgi:hypothetical protein
MSARMPRFPDSPGGSAGAGVPHPAIEAEPRERARAGPDHALSAMPRGRELTLFAGPARRFARPRTALTSLRTPTAPRSAANRAGFLVHRNQRPKMITTIT